MSEWYLLSIYSEPGPSTCCASHVLTHLDPSEVLRDRYYSDPWFKGEGGEVREVMQQEQDHQELGKWLDRGRHQLLPARANSSPLSGEELPRRPSRKVTPT